MFQNDGYTHKTDIGHFNFWINIAFYIFKIFFSTVGYYMFYLSVLDRFY